MCYMGCIYEILAMVAAFLSAVLGSQIQEFKIPNIHFPDVILIFVVIPFVHLLNNEDTKSIIFEEGWIQGIKCVLGIYKDRKLGENVVSSDATERTRTERNTPHGAFSPIIASLTTSQRRVIFRKCKSSINMASKDGFLLAKEKIHLERRYSLRQDVLPGSFVLITNEINSEFHNTLARRVSTKITKNEIQTNIVTKSCHTSPCVIYIDD